LLCGRGSRLIPRSPAEAAKKKKVSGQYAAAEIGQAASELQWGQRAIWGWCVEAAEVGSMGENRGCRARNVEVERSRR
ncbi:hypothetical protein FOFC_03660, partial [Fusarium oxysporum]